MKTHQENAPKIKPLFPFPLLIALGTTALVLLAVNLLGWAGEAGFLGTFAPRLVDVNLVMQVALLIVLITGLVMIKKKNTRSHRGIMTAVVFFSILFAVFIMIGRLMLSYSSGSAGVLLIIHSLIGLSAILCGLYLVLLMNDRLPKSWRTKKWKLVMRVTWLLFLAAILAGLTIYWRMYIP